MKRQGWLLFIILIQGFLLSGCLNGVWTGADLIYNRHSFYKKFNDFKLGAEANQLLFRDEVLKQPGCALDLVVFNGDVLLAGHVPSRTLRREAEQRLSQLSPYRELFNQVAIDNRFNNGVEDTWITTKIRSLILANSSINPNDFKIITIDQIVYVMGDVKPEQARLVLDIARKTVGVVRVVKLLKYYHLSERN